MPPKRSNRPARLRRRGHNPDVLARLAELLAFDRPSDPAWSAGEDEGLLQARLTLALFGCAPKGESATETADGFTQIGNSGEDDRPQCGIDNSRLTPSDLVCLCSKFQQLSVVALIRLVRSLFPLFERHLMVAKPYHRRQIAAAVYRISAAAPSGRPPRP
jgi:hypothetical protein